MSPTSLEPTPVDSVDCCFSRGRLLLLSLGIECNQRCVHCMRTATLARPRPIDPETLFPALADAIPALSVERVVISGGEPTLISNLPLVISEISRHGAKPSLCTNGVRVDEASAQDFSRAGLAAATIGLEGIEEDYEWFRGYSGGHERALQGASCLIEAGIRVTVNVTLHNRILHSADTFADALNDLGLSSICVTAPMFRGRLENHWAHFDEVNEHAINAFVVQLRRRAGCRVTVRIPRCNSSTCPSGRRVFSMNRRGEVDGCPDVGAENVADLVASGGACDHGHGEPGLN